MGQKMLIVVSLARIAKLMPLLPAEGGRRGVGACARGFLMVASLGVSIPH